MTVGQAMVLAAGLGTRMRPLTHMVPKPLLRVNDKALLDWALDALDEAGVKRVVVNTHHLGRQVENAVRTRASVTCIHEDPVLETGGGVKNALDAGLLAIAPVFVINADNLWVDEGTPALERLAQAWDDQNMDGLLLLQPLSAASGYDGAGDFWLPEGEGGPVRRRADDGESQDAFVFTGVQILHPRLFSGAPDGAFSLNVLYDQALANGRLHGLVHTGGWHHVGTPEALSTTDALLRNSTDSPA